MEKALSNYEMGVMGIKYQVQVQYDPNWPGGDEGTWYEQTIWQETEEDARHMESEVLKIKEVARTRIVKKVETWELVEGEGNV